MKATNDRLAKLEQMYEELTILEQKAASGTISNANASIKTSTGNNSKPEKQSKSTKSTKSGAALRKSGKSPTEVAGSRKDN